MQPPLGYVAPELANADGAGAATAISTAADIFSLGMCCWQVLDWHTVSLCQHIPLLLCRSHPSVLWLAALLGAAAPGTGPRLTGCFPKQWCFRHMRCMQRKFCFLLTKACAGMEPTSWALLYSLYACVRMRAAAIAYEVLSGQALLPVGFELADYNGRLAALQQAPMPGAPPALLPTLRAMLAHSPSLRPPAISFTAAGYFQARAPAPSLLLADEGRHGLCRIDGRFPVDLYIPCIPPRSLYLRWHAKHWKQRVMHAACAVHSQSCR